MPNACHKSSKLHATNHLYRRARRKVAIPRQANLFISPPPFAFWLVYENEALAAGKHQIPSSNLSKKLQVANTKNRAWASIEDTPRRTQFRL
jgi:hypothetical protein